MIIRIFRLLVTFMLCISVLAGCNVTSSDLEGSLTDNNENTILQKENIQNYPSTKEEIAEAYPDKTVLTWVYNDYNYIAPSLNEAVNEYLDGIGESYVIYFEMISDDNFESEINERIGGGDAPDIITAGIGLNGSLSGMTRAMKNDWPLQLDEYLRTEEGQKLWAALPEKYWELCSYYGHYYGYGTDMTLTDTYAYYVNTELMEKYDITAEELAETDIIDMRDIFSKVYEGENGNVNMLELPEDSTLRVNTSGLFFPLTDSSGVKSDALVWNLHTEEQEFVNLFEDEEAVTYFIALSEYNKAGYMENDGYTFLMPYYHYMYDEYNEYYMEYYADYFGGADNITIVKRNHTELIQQRNTMIIVCKASTHQTEALSAITHAAADIELSTLLLCGVEGIDYTLNDDKIESLYFGQESSLGFTLPAFGNFFNCIATVDEPWDTEKRTAALFELVETSPLSEQRDCVIYLKEYEAQVDEIQSIVQDYKTGLYAGTYEDVPAVLEELNERLKEAGIDEVLEEANRQLNANELPAALLETK